MKAKRGRKNNDCERTSASTEKCRFRKRYNFKIVDASAYRVPHCPHGPCLLFERKTKKGVIKRYFACAVYRSEELCSCRWNVSEDGPYKGLESDNECESSSKFAQPYGIILQKAKIWRKAHRKYYYCATCNDLVIIPHKDPVTGPLKKQMLAKPTQLFSAHTRSDAESQFWFSSESLKVLTDVVSRSQSDGVLCVGTPTLFEYYRSSLSLRKAIKAFLLDVDPRFVPFFRQTNFARYSMLTHHFYDSQGLRNLDAFLASVHHLLIVCDPPFGVFMDALVPSLNKLRSRHVEITNNSALSDVIVILPVFIGKHLIRLDSNIHMIDYKVTYTNHPKYSRASKSVIRLFTDLPPVMFDLSGLCDYRYCDLCERHVLKTNLHCFKCGICPSLDGSPFKHCAQCDRCVKSIYKHCKSCKRCHLPGRCVGLKLSK